MLLTEIEPLKQNAKGYITYNGKVYHKATLMKILAGQPQPQLKKKKNPVGNHRKKPVIAIDREGRQYPFPSSAQAAIVLGINRSNIPKALINPNHSVEGYKFKYA